MKLDKLLVIIKREYLTRVKSKGFVIATVLTPLLMASLLFLPALLARKGPADHRVVVVDQTGDVDFIDRAMSLLTAENASQDRFQVRSETVSETQREARLEELKGDIRAGKLDIYVLIPASVLHDGRIAYHAKSIGNFIVETRVENAFNTAVIERRMSRSGLDVEVLSQLSRKIILDKFNIRGEGEDWRKMILAFSLMGILCLTVLAYGGHTMSAVIEEKQSRIVEVLLSSVEPFQLMLGKLIGVGFVGLTQYTVWAVFAVLLSGLAETQLPALGLITLPPIPVSLMVCFVVFFLLGYFLYATLFVMVGGIVSNEEDGQQMQFPLMILILLAPLASSLVWRHPDSVLAITISMFPFFSPFSMFLRIAIQQPPLWQILLSILLLIATILGAVWLAAKLYRIGVLMYGKRPTLPEIAKWLTYT